MKRRLPKGAETLPVLVSGTKMLTPAELRESHPELMGNLAKAGSFASDALLKERFRRRFQQGRVKIIFNVPECPIGGVTPEEQLKHVEAGDAVGKKIMSAERLILIEELAILAEEAQNG